MSVESVLVGIFICFATAIVWTHFHPAKREVPYSVKVILVVRSLRGFPAVGRDKKRARVTFQSRLLWTSSDGNDGFQWV